MTLTAYYSAYVNGQTYTAIPASATINVDGQDVYEYFTFPDLTVTALKPDQTFFVVFSFHLPKLRILELYRDLRGPSKSCEWSILVFHPRYRTHLSIGVAPSSPTTTTSSSSETATPSSLPIGAIVGGAVGGVVATAIIIAIAWYCVTKVKTQRQMGSGYPPEDQWPQVSEPPSSPRPMSPAVEKPMFDPPGLYVEHPRRLGAEEQTGLEVEEERVGSPRLRYPDTVVSGNLLPDRGY